MRHQLDLRANAIDSLNEGLRCYIRARDGREIRSYKFAVLHFAHFIELLLKHAVAKEHPLLIYEKPAAKNLTSDKRTIGLWDAMAILSNAGMPLDEELARDVGWLKALRNDIEHYSFDMDVTAVRSALGRIIRAANDFVDSMALDPLAPVIDTDCQGVFAELVDEYKNRLANAKLDARAQAEVATGELVDCGHCGESAVAVQQTDAVRCLFCEHKESVRVCSICAQRYRESEMWSWNNDDPNDVSYACLNCEDQIFNRE
jgi:hypothetical protein